MEISTNIVNGHDTFGSFAIMAGRCPYCNNVGLIIQWDEEGFFLPVDIENPVASLNQDGPYVGLDCGCYGKFHRQVARIDQRAKDYNGTHR